MNVMQSVVIGVLSSISTTLISYFFWKFKIIELYRQKAFEEQIIAYKKLNSLLHNIEFIISSADPSTSIVSEVKKEIHEYMKEHQLFLSKTIEDEFYSIINYFSSPKEYKLSQFKKEVSTPLRMQLKKELQINNLANSLHMNTNLD